MSKEQSCAERVKDQMQARDLDLGRMVEDMQSEDIDDMQAAQEARDSLALDVEVLRTVKILLSTGGPADWLIATGKPGEYTPATVEYHFADWFDHAQLPVERGTELWNYASEIWELTCGG